MAFTKIEHFEHEHIDTHHDSAISVTDGVAEQPIVNPHFVRKKRRTISTEEYVEGILKGDITILSQAITLIESANEEHQTQAQQIIEACLPHSGHSIRVGITGVPGAGKSSFIEATGGLITSLKHRLAVLAIDPSSERSGGSILGDKTRMSTISANPDVFIRPSPSAGSLGGVARKTRETIILCEAAGFDVIFVETVGVGQSETVVHSMVDIFVLLQISGAGDDLQGIKRGIMEMSDMMVITKADGDNIISAQAARTQYDGALKLFPMPESGLRPAVFTCSSRDGVGLEEVWNGVESYIEHTKGNGYYEHRRHEQLRYWMRETIHAAIMADFYGDARVAAALETYEERVLKEQITPFVAAKELMECHTNHGAPCNGMGSTTNACSTTKK